MTTVTRITRQLAAGVLLAGGLAAFLSSFLPFGTATFPGDIYSPGPIPSVFVPAQNLMEALQIGLQTSI